ncbi:TIGR01244 family sulfur transferase [Bordetella bronchialis]|uniref:TIGR01244 family protein n=1 Tax=Bordetella bronchialis TaxID=463025 RepID=A0A193FLQ3_9BORD|nr:TIGR01244 family sulfur transferase [Bordetella bronchialis]ANN68605.1 TIGR01244 family protein [Bordetella bronchialis]ANN73743.1 TIGR01244 family protein [Bordetella bronchialis]
MSVPINRLTETFAVAPQLSPDDMAAVAAAGYKSVIINRPDYEGGPDQPTAAAVSQAALNAGLNVEYQPVVSGGMTTEDVARFAQLLDTLPQPILAYCRTGTRCTNLFVAAQHAGSKGRG